MFADAKTPESRKFVRQGGYITFFPRIQIVEGPADVTPDAGMKNLKGTDDLI